MNVSVTGDFQAYWDSRPRQLAKNLRRYQRRAEQELGMGDLRVLNRPEDMPDALARYGQLESDGWKGREGTAVNASNQQGRFYTQVMRNFCDTGQAEVLEYWLGGELAASRLVIRNANMTILLKTAYNERLSMFAPGRMLLKYALRREFDRGTQHSVEFYTNATQDQLAWATGKRTISHLTCFRSIWLAKIYDLIQGVKKKSQTCFAESSSSYLVDRRVWNSACVDVLWGPCKQHPA